MASENIFSALAKYNSARDENYLTEAFVFLINSLLLKERTIGLEILTQLCANNNEFSFDEDEAISISTQETTEQGTPDIRVLSPDKLIYIEVKHDSPLGYKQIERYKKALDSSPATIKHVNLLTRFAVDFGEEGERPYKHVRWYEVYNWLSNGRTRVKDPICVYLIDSFNSFLEVKQMSFQKVGWEYINGVPALLNLLNMIEVAIQGAGLTLYAGYPRAVAKDSRGFYIENNKLWCGIFYDAHLEIMFQVVDKTDYNKNRLKNPSYKIDEDKWGIYFHLPLEDYYFFSLNKDEQLELITKFVKTAYAEAKRMRIKQE